MNIFWHLIKFSALAMIISASFVSCGQQAERRFPTQTSTVDDALLEPTQAEQIIVLLPTFTPTASPTPTLPSKNQDIAVPTETNGHTKQPLPVVTYTPKPMHTPRSPTTHPTVAPTATSRYFALWSVTDPLNRVVYTSNEMGNLEIFATWLRYGEPTQLTDSPTEDTHPALSPDGMTVAFASDRHGNFDLFLVDFEGGNLRRLTYNDADDTQPAWSPDGSQIVFVSKRDGNNELYILEVACALQKNDCPDEPYRMTRSVYDDLVPDWSPDGQRIAFMTGRDGNLEIYHAKTDGLDIVRLTDNPGVDGFPTWSPDSTMIAFHSEREGTFDIYARSIHGDDEWRLTYDGYEDLAPDWHGENILYMSSRWGRFRIYLVQAPGITPQIDPLEVWTTSRRTFVGYPSWGRFDPSK